MTKIREVSDRSACAAWCPVASHPDMVVLGSKDSGGIGFEDTGGELELYDLSLSASEKDAKPQLVAAPLKTSVRFSSIVWGPYHGSENQFTLGLIAGGMTDGKVHVWDASSLLQDDKTKKVEPICTVLVSEGQPVSAMSFHPLEPWQLATGSANGQVAVVDLSSCRLGPGSRPSVVNPAGMGTTTPAQSAEITAVAWNSQVAHILASSSRDGTVGVWDLKACKAWCKLQVEHGPVSDTVWNPKEGLFLLTASGDDRNPVLKVWDLGASTSMPLTTMAGHSAGLLKVSWCPHDPTLLVSCGKDNRTLLWDLTVLQAVAELPADTDDRSQQQTQLQSQHSSSASATGAGQLFATSSSLSGQKHMRTFVVWSPLKRGLALTTSLDKKVQIHSILSLATQCGRPPAWMRPSCAVTTGFGGTVVTVTSKARVATITTVQEQKQLAQISSAFEYELATVNTLELCEKRRREAKTPTEEKMWGFMRVIFESNAREQLLEHLGFDADQIADAASQFAPPNTDLNGSGTTSLDVSERSAKDGKHPKPPPPPPKKGTRDTMSKAAEEVVKKALIVGNFEAAVECCFQTGNLSDALLLAYCGGADLWTKTQERYFKKESANRPYLTLVQGIVAGKLEEMVAQSDTSKWQETLAILSTYSQSEDFPRLCISLGDRLESAGDAENASLCYMCSLSVEHAGKYWIAELEKANGKKGSLDLLALHDLVVKVSVFMKATQDKTGLELPPKLAEYFFEYSKALAEEGLFVSAAKYCRGSSEESMILRDRLYRCKDSQACLAQLGTPPDFPYTPVNVSQSRGTVYASDVRAQEQQMQQQQQLQQQQQQQAAQAYAEQQQQQQQQYSQQQSYAAQQSASNQSQMSSSNELPPGWIELQDPSSGMTYYANQTTGESSWERPVAAPAPVPAVQPSYSNIRDDATAVSQHSTASATSRSTKAHLVSKYGDGFVTSASHPELAEQYGNVGTSNPYHGMSRPGTAQSVLAQQGAQPIEQAPPSGPFDISTVQLSAQQESIKANFVALYDYLVSVASSSEKRQLEEAKKGIEILVKRMSRNGIDEETEAQVIGIVTAISNHDFRGATAVLTALVNHEWKTHKDWLKGIKLLLQLALKKIG